ncbi:MAG TPA: signal peptidase I [Dermatophilaceae bacterium]|nr:signal peptidase I [Dermatophilaceae bacterium]
MPISPARPGSSEDPVTPALGPGPTTSAGSEVGGVAGSDAGGVAGSEADGVADPAGAPRGPGEPVATEAPPASRRRSVVAATGTALREVVVVVVMALALSFVIKTWLLQAFYIPSSSMEDTLLVGDRVVVNKLVPGAMDLQRGDVVVFSDPGDWLVATPRESQGTVRDAVHEGLVFVGLLPSTSDDHLIKRVVGLPGDRVSCCGADGRLQVNGEPLDEGYVRPGDPPSTIPFDITVPADRVWVMGDHRSDSEDSRYHDDAGDGRTGSVPLTDVTGRAVAVVWPFDRFTRLANPLGNG